jgi:hypothetical protein
MPLSLFIPDFSRRFRAAGAPRLPALERMRARAGSRHAADPQGFLAPIFGLDPGDLAAAPFMRFADAGRPEPGYWLCADPVHLAPDRDRLVLMTEPLLGVESAEAEALVAGFNDLYAADGWQLEARRTAHWYLRCPRPLAAITHDPDAIAGGGILQFMPSGDDADDLKRLMNEVQMLFHTHAVNRSREEAGRPPINSLWLWGGGELPKQHAAGSRQVWTAAPLLSGLALWSGAQPDPVPESWDSSSHAASGVLDLAGCSPEELEQRWFAPLLSSLQRGALDEVNIYLGGLERFNLSSSAARRFWRRGGPIALAIDE